MPAKPPARPASSPAGSPADHEVLEGEVLAVRYQDEARGFAVVRLAGPAGEVEAAGELAPVVRGESLRLHGRWVEHPRFGRQFKAGWSERLTPTTLEGLRRYLGSGVFRGVGPDLAGRLVAHFGERTLEALRAGAERLREVPGIGPKRAAALAEVFRESTQRHRVLAELRGFGLGGRHASELYAAWRERAIERVRKDPYALVGDLRGFGFRAAEAVARRLGIPEDSPARAAGVTAHLLRQAAREGHASLPGSLLRARLAELGVPETAAEAGFAALQAGRRLVVEGEAGEQEWFYLSGLWQDETGVAREIGRLLASPAAEGPGAARLAAAASGLAFEPDAEQQAAVASAWRFPFSVLTGGPGTGKTTVMRMLLDLLETEGLRRIRLASPTGRAAKRLHEATGRNATTIHRLLGFDPGSGGFHHDASRRLDLEYLVVDEVSMLDLPLAHALLQAVPDGARVLFVGDADQLPAVGPGSVLKDLVLSGAVPVSRLRHIHRQARGSSIVQAAHDVLAGRVPRGADPGSPGDFFVVPRQDPQGAAEVLERMVCERIPRRYGWDPRQDVLVLSPMYRGPLGVDALNERLGRRLNPGAEGPAWARPFRPGDRVMVVRNDYEREVFNGDSGLVVAITGDELLAEFGGRVQSWKPDQLGDLVPAWCVTVHRAQGSEARAVVVVVGWSHWLLLRRNLLYTALTRGRELVVLVAHPGALGRAVANAEEDRRYGRLSDRIAST